MCKVWKKDGSAQKKWAFYLLSHVYFLLSQVMNIRSILLTFFLFSGYSFSGAQTNGWFTFDTTNSAIPSNIVTAVITDADNDVWVGTFSGLAKFEDFFNWTILDASTSNLPDNRITCLNIDNGGKIWAGTLTGGLAIWDGTTFIQYNTANTPLLTNKITSVNFEGTVAWITTDGGGLYRFDGNTWTRFDNQNSGFDLAVCYDVAVDGSGNKWIATLNEGLMRLTPGGIFTGFRADNSAIPHTYVRSVAVENDTSIWVGMGFTDNDSCLARFNGSSGWYIFSAETSSGIHFRNVWDIDITADGEKWIATNDADHGAILYNDTTVADYSSFNSGLPFNRVYSMAKDTANVWFATPRGLAVFNEKNAFLSTSEPVGLLSAAPYPNPTSDRLHISLSAEVHQVRADVFSADGRWLMRKRWDDMDGVDVSFSVESFPPGFYFMRMEARGQSDYVKFIVR
jgi:ligand-binding sensor domain-containing protein